MKPWTKKQQREYGLKILWDEHRRLLSAYLWAHRYFESRGDDPNTYMVPKDGSLDPMRTAKSAIQAQLSENATALYKAMGLKDEGRQCRYCLVRPATHFYAGHFLGPRYGEMGQSGCADPACDKTCDVWGGSIGYARRHPYYWVTETSKHGKRRYQQADREKAELLVDGKWVRGKWNPDVVEKGVHMGGRWEPA
jgi:hypothetical protein